MLLLVFFQNILDCRDYEAGPIRECCSNLRELPEFEKVILFIQDNRGCVSKLRQDGTLNHYPRIPLYGIRCNVKQNGNEFKTPTPLSEETETEIGKCIRLFLSQQEIENVIITLQHIVNE